ncbi:hypothetical protein [Pseudobacillus badius]|uniref:hypothetical protein n=1 Tax=Bacillus badius TaxID=1455 RepID=UPI0007B3AC79|nr:hypothetical protein [Bacillus badius]KZR58348.1 hypothetical protein A3781_17260 [Bacillus badius]
MKEVDIYQFNKYEITEMLEKLRRIFKDPETSIFDMSENLYEEVLNTPTDKEGYTPVYYLSESLKSLLEILKQENLI